MKLNEPGRQKSEKQLFLAVGKACLAIFIPTPDLKDGTFDSSGFSPEGIPISAFALPRPGVFWFYWGMGER